jgi:hypothetical protein
MWTFEAEEPQHIFSDGKSCQVLEAEYGQKRLEHLMFIRVISR